MDIAKAKIKLTNGKKLTIGYGINISEFTETGIFSIFGILLKILYNSKEWYKKIDENSTNQNAYMQRVNYFN